MITAYHFIKIRKFRIHLYIWYYWQCWKNCGVQYHTPPFFFLRFYFFPFAPQSPPVHSCIFFVVGPSSCGMWDAASAWPDERCHVRAQDSNQWSPGPPKLEHANLTTRPRVRPQYLLFLCHIQRKPPQSSDKQLYRVWTEELAFVGKSLRSMKFDGKQSVGKALRHGPTLLLSQYSRASALWCLTSSMSATDTRSQSPWHTHL